MPLQAIADWGVRAYNTPKAHFSDLRKKISTEAQVNYTLLNKSDLPHGEYTYEFEGTLYQDTGVSFIWVDMPPKGAIRLHKHPYPEIFIIQEGIATFTVGATTLEAHAGQIIIVPAEMPHKFTNNSDRPLKQMDIHVSKQFITHWLETEAP